jgi:hypothetical protein
LIAASFRHIAVSSLLMLHYAFSVFTLITLRFIIFAFVGLIGFI